MHARVNKTRTCDSSSLQTTEIKSITASGEETRTAELELGAVLLFRTSDSFRKLDNYLFLLVSIHAFYDRERLVLVLLLMNSHTAETKTAI
jgi:hypothetical protein